MATAPNPPITPAAAARAIRDLGTCEAARVLRVSEGELRRLANGRPAAIVTAAARPSPSAPVVIGRLRTAIPLSASPVIFGRSPGLRANR